MEYSRRLSRQTILVIATYIIAMHDCTTIWKDCTTLGKDCTTIWEDCTALGKDCATIWKDSTSMFKDCATIGKDCTTIEKGLVIRDQDEGKDRCCLLMEEAQTYNVT